MKTPVAVTLIIMGTLLVVTPALSDYFFQRNLVTLMASHPEFTSVNLDGKMQDLYRIGCWVTGSLMVGIAVFCSLFAESKTATHEALVTREA
jgi:hypothetical protein